jgi:hypothetical protein
MSASHSITAVQFTLMMANPLQENLMKPFVISKKNFSTVYLNVPKGWEELTEALKK